MSQSIFALPFSQMATKLLINREYVYRQIFQRGWCYIKPGLKPLSGSVERHIFSIFNTWGEKKLFQFLVCSLWRHMPQNNSSRIFCSVKLSGCVAHCLFFLSNSRNARTSICSFHIWALCQQSPCCAGGVGMNGSENALHFPFLTYHNTDGCLPIWILSNWAKSIILGAFR